MTNALYLIVRGVFLSEEIQIWLDFRLVQLTTASPLLHNGSRPTVIPELDSIFTPPS